MKLFKLRFVRITAVVLLTIATMYVYRTQTEITSRSQSISVLSKYGHVELVDSTMIFTHKKDMLGFNSEVLKALEIQSNHYTIYLK